MELGDILPTPQPGVEWAVNFERRNGPEASTWALTFGDIRRLGRLRFGE